MNLLLTRGFINPVFLNCMNWKFFRKMRRKTLKEMRMDQIGMLIQLFQKSYNQDPHSTKGKDALGMLCLLRGKYLIFFSGRNYQIVYDNEAGSIHSQPNKQLLKLFIMECNCHLYLSFRYKELRESRELETRFRA